MDDVTRKRFEQRLREKIGSETVISNLISAGLVLVSYELLKSEVIGNTRGFYLSGFDETGFTYSPEYKSQVVDLDKNRFRASCLWLASRGALSDSDVEMAERIRQQRHAVAHELPELLVDPDAEIDMTLILEARQLLAKLGRYWGQIEVDTNPDFDDVDVDSSGISSGSMLLMEHIAEILGLDEG